MRSRANSSAFLPANLRAARPLLDALREIAGRHDATAAQIALAWVIRHPNVVVIPGASTVAQLERNAAASDIELDDDEAERLEATAAAYHPTSGVAALPALVRNRLHRTRNA